MEFIWRYCLVKQDKKFLFLGVIPFGQNYLIMPNSSNTISTDTSTIVLLSIIVTIVVVTSPQYW